MTTARWEGALRVRISVATQEVICNKNGKFMCTAPVSKRIQGGQLSIDHSANSCTPLPPGHCQTVFRHPGYLTSFVLRMSLQRFGDNFSLFGFFQLQFSSSLGKVLGKASPHKQTTLYMALTFSEWQHTQRTPSVSAVRQSSSSRGSLSTGSCWGLFLYLAWVCPDFPSRTWTELQAVSNTNFDLRLSPVICWHLL